MKYRIVRIEKFNNIYYIVQYKFLFLWLTIVDYLDDRIKKFSTLGEAEEEVKKEKFKTKKTIVKVYD